jgi:hypothetical protein
MSSDLASSDEKPVASKEINSEESLESLDESLDAILNEAKEAAPSTDGNTAAGESPAEPSAHEPPPAEVQMALSESAPADSADLDDEGTPLPVVVDDEPSYKAFADMVAPDEEPKTAEPIALEAAEAAAEEARKAAAAFEPPVLEAITQESAAVIAAPPPAEEAQESEEAEEIFEAESLVESMTPAPVLETAPESMVATQESESYTPPPPTDEEILGNVVLPQGAMASSLSSLDEDRTVISPMPAMPAIPEAAPTLPTMRASWGMGTPLESTAPILLRQYEDGFTDKLKKVVTSRVQTSVATLAVVVLAASALGGAVVKMTGSSPAPKTALTAPAKVETAVVVPAVAPLPAAAPAPVKTAEATPAEKPAVAEKPAPVEKPAPAHPVAHAKPHPAAASGTHIALAAPPVKTAAAKRPAPAPVAAKGKKPAAGAHAQPAGWVDPFGQ